MTTSKPAPDAVTIPVALRVGGAFMLLAVVLVALVFVAVLSEGWMAPFEWTPARLAVVAAALIVGAFATVRIDQRPSVAQVAALVVALALIVVSRFLPHHVLTVMSQPLVLIYASVAGVCAVILRRTAIVKSA